MIHRRFVSAYYHIDGRLLIVIDVSNGHYATHSRAYLRTPGSPSALRVERYWR